MASGGQKIALKPAVRVFPIYSILLRFARSLGGLCRERREEENGGGGSLRHDCLHNMSACADELPILPTSLTPSALTHTRSTFPQNPQISFHQHPPIYNPQLTTTGSFIQQSPISNPTYLRHHGYYHEPFQFPKFLPLTNDYVPLLFLPTVMVEEEATKSQKFNADPVSVVAEEHKMLINEAFKTPDRSVDVAPAVKGEDDEVNFKEIITASKFSTIADEENFTNTADLTIPETSERSQELIVATEKDQEETLH